MLTTCQAEFLALYMYHVISFLTEAWKGTLILGPFLSHRGVKKLVQNHIGRELPGFNGASINTILSCLQCRLKRKSQEPESGGPSVPSPRVLPHK